MDMSTWFAIGMLCTGVAGYLLGTLVRYRPAGSCESDETRPLSQQSGYGSAYENSGDLDQAMYIANSWRQTIKRPHPGA